MEYSRQREVVYWHHRTKTSLFHRGLEHSIAFVHADGSIPDSSRFNDDVITTSLICTNRMIPARLHIGDICVAVNKNPAVASFHNVTRPTQSLWPVTDGDMHWSLISAMNLNYLSLLDRETLIQILRTFDLPGAHHPQRARLSRQKLDAIEKLETKPVDRLFKGVPVRGLATTLWIRPDPFICEGEIYLLGTVLSHFFALYASINSYHCLKIINTESQEAGNGRRKWVSTPLYSGKTAVIGGCAQLQFLCADGGAVPSVWRSGPIFPCVPSQPKRSCVSALTPISVFRVRT